jgi:hypothetical protein
MTRSHLPMKSVHLFSFAVMLCMLLTGCASLESTRSSGDFVRSIDLSIFDTFSYQDTVVSGTAFRDFQELEITELSNQVLREALTTRGYDAVESGGDFYVVAKWHKALSAYAGIFDSVDGPTSAMNRRNSTNSSGAVRVTVIVELYETATDELFWRAELPSIFDAIQYSGKRVSRSLRRAIQDFPDRIETDPN